MTGLGMSRNPPQRRNARARNGVAPKRPGSFTAGLVRAAHPGADAASVMLTSRQWDGSAARGGRRRFTGSVHDSPGSRREVAQRQRMIRQQNRQYHGSTRPNQYQQQKQKQKQKQKSITVKSTERKQPGQQTRADGSSAAGAAFFLRRQALPARGFARGHTPPPFSPAKKGGITALPCLSPARRKWRRTQDETRCGSRVPIRAA